MCSLAKPSDQRGMVQCRMPTNKTAADCGDHWELNTANWKPGRHWEATRGQAFPQLYALQFAVDNPAAQPFARLDPRAPNVMEQSLPDFERAFERWRQVAGMVLAPSGFILVYCVTGSHLEPEGRSLAAILAAVAVLWVTEALPLPVTAILGACLSVHVGRSRRQDGIRAVRGPHCLSVHRHVHPGPCHDAALSGPASGLGRACRFAG